MMFIAAFFLSLHVSGQEDIKGEDTFFPPEAIEVHLARTSYFPEEVVAFALYCTNPLFPELELSKLAFIELISEQNSSIIREKILLENGVGTGTFQLPEGTPSGVYTLLAYTHWLKNFGEESFHQQHIVVLNPNQEIPLAPDAGRGTADPVTQAGIKLNTNKKQYAHREKVTLRILPDQKEAQRPAGGHFSITVRLSEPFLLEKGSRDRVAAREGIREHQINFLPDYNGIRLTGTLENASGSAIPEADIILSEPGPGTSIHKTSTDVHGKFNLLLPAKEGESDLVFTLPEEKAVINLDEPYWNGFRASPQLPLLRIHQTDASDLEMRYSRFQLKKRLNIPDFSPLEEVQTEQKVQDPFYSHPGRTFHMKEYIRLDSLSEYFYELIPSVQIVQNRSKSEIKVMDPVTFNWIEEAPGLFLDGVLYPDYRGISLIPVSKLDRITILSEVYHYHDFTFGGIIDIHTTESDFNEVPLLANMTRFIYPLTSRSRFKYNSRDYSETGLSDRIPDLRSVLLWKTDITIDTSNEKEVRFFTGDVSGEYTIEITGITSEGEIVRTETRINVGIVPEKNDL